MTTSFDGNAVCNYFFFTNSTFQGRTPENSRRAGARSERRSRPEAVGNKTTTLSLKRSHRRPESSFPLQALSATTASTGTLRSLYYANKKFHKIIQNGLLQLLGIHRYQQERIRVDVMYKHWTIIWLSKAIKVFSYPVIQG
jgi:hypothetical protein